MEANSQRKCPHCGTPVAQKADTCLMCGAQLKERTRRSLRLPEGELLLPVLIVAAIVILWLWKPWQAEQPLAMAPDTPAPTATPSPLPTATYVVAPTATPLYSPTPPPTATLPPDQTIHIVESGETIITIAKLYGTTKSAVLKANGLKDSSIIHVGDKLIIPLPVANTATPTPTLTPSPTPAVYTVKSGDTLSAIAKKFNTTVEAIMQANGIADATRLKIGAKLTIAPPPDFSSTMAYENYEVEEGDTLISIANEFDVSVATIREANSLKDNTLRVGQDLRIPVGTATPVPTPTSTPTLTPSPGPPYPAPPLLGPPDGALLKNTGADILVNWASVGILAEDEWYVVRVRRTGSVVQQLPLVWTKATSWRLPPEVYADNPGGTQQFQWQVYIMRQTGIDEDGARTGDEISLRSEMRTFAVE